MSDIQIFDKVIPHAYADQIEKDLLRRAFPWHYVSDVTTHDYGSNSGFVHIAYDLGSPPSEWYPFIKPIVYSIAEAAKHNILELLRIRVGLLTPSAESDYQFNTPHVDFTMPHYTACYYVSDSDGDTVLFDQKLNDTGIIEFTDSNFKQYVENTKFTIAERSRPKKGKVCVFDGLRFHSSTKPKQHERRMVITVNYIGTSSV